MSMDLQAEACGAPCMGRAEPGADAIAPSSPAPHHALEEPRHLEVWSTDPAHRPCARL